MPKNAPKSMQSPRLPNYRSFTLTPDERALRTP